MALVITLARVRRARLLSSRSVVVPALLTVAMLAACGGGPKKSTVVTPFSQEDRILFDESLDTIDNPTLSTEGTGWVGEFERRVLRADFIAVLKLTSLNSDTGTDRRVTYRLVGQTSDTIKGRPPREVTLRVEEGERGFRSIRRAEDRLMLRPHMLYGKWQQDAESGERRIRWHLSPDTPAVRTKARAALRGDPNAPDTTVEVVSE